MKNEIVNYDDKLTPGFKFSLKEIHAMGVMNIHMVKKLIHQGEIEYIKIGNKTHVARFELVRYLSSITVNCTTVITIKNYDEQLSPGFKFSLRELENARVIDVSMAKKLIKNNAFAYLKIGNKLHITRDELIRFFNENTFRKSQK